MVERARRTLPEGWRLEEVPQREFIVCLPEMLAIANTWLDERPTIRTIYEVGKNLPALKNHFLKTHRRYVVGAVEEAIELCRAISFEDQREELGDVAFYLLHFFRAAELEIGELFNHLGDRQSLPGQRTVRPWFPLSRAVGRGLVLKAVKDMARSSRESHNLLFGGLMSFGDDKEDAPWLDPGSEQWLEFKRVITHRWMVAFCSVMDLADQMGVVMVELVKETSEKAAINFPKIFFQTDFSWFSSDLNGDVHDAGLCRLFRDVPREGGSEGNYLSLFREEEERLTPESFRSLVVAFLDKITLLPDERSNRARYYLKEISYIQQSE